MKKIPFLLIAALLLGGCTEKQPDELSVGEDWAHLVGAVKYASNLEAVPNAFIRTLNHLESTLTDSLGEYDLAIALPKDETESVTLEIYKEGYLTVSLPTVIQAGATTEIPTITLERYLDSTVTDTNVTGSGPGEVIVVISVDPETLGVSGSGWDNVSEIVCEVQDASGRAVDSLHAAQINFELIEDPGGGAVIYPATDVTDNSGRVSTAFYAGTDAGIAIIKAQFAESSTFTLLPVIHIYQTGPPASIEIAGVEFDSISVSGTGANEASTVTFVVKDAGGSPVSGETSYQVNFEILGETGGGEYLYPVSDSTDAQGRVSTTLNSGTTSGTIMLRAYLASDTTISSTPIPITIHSWLPDASHFGVYPRYVNFPGYNYFGRMDSLIAIVGDMYSNPVPLGTSVYFTTNAGIIEGSATTDTSGFAAVRLYSGPPVPSPSYPFGTITAQTVGEGGVLLTSSTEVLFSGATQIALLDTPYFDIPDGGSKTFEFRVMDQHGYPLAHDTKIEVATTAGGVLGDVDVTFPDTQDTLSWTYFSFVIFDNNPGDVDPPVIAAVTISVTSPNGDASMIIDGQMD